MEPVQVSLMTGGYKYNNELYNLFKELDKVTQ